MNMIQLNESSVFRTSDISLASTIQLLSRPLEAVDRTRDPKKAEFLFLHDTQLDELIERFWKGQVSVEPKAFTDAMRYIKARLYER